MSIRFWRTVLDYEPASEVNDLTPSSLNHIIGQPHVVEQIKVALDACQQDGNPFPHSLLVGPAGTGKSQIANVIAKEMASDFEEVLASSLNEGSLNALLLSAKDKGIIHIDECHQLKSLFEKLYFAMDKKVVVIGKKNGRSPQTIPLNDITILLSTTEEYSLPQSIRDRCKLNLQLQFYSEEDLAQLIYIRSKILKWEVHPSVIPQIAQRSKQTPRIGLRLFQSCRRVCRALGEHEITDKHLHKACLLERIDNHGLDQNQQQYIKILLDGDSKLNVIASRIGLPSKTVSAVIEPFLIRAGFVIKNEKAGRQLTAMGRGHAIDLSEAIDV